MSQVGNVYFRLSFSYHLAAHFDRGPIWDVILRSYESEPREGEDFCRNPLTWNMEKIIFYCFNFLLMLFVWRNHCVIWVLTLMIDLSNAEEFLCNYFWNFPVLMSDYVPSSILLNCGFTLVLPCCFWSFGLWFQFSDVTGVYGSPWFTRAIYTGRIQWSVSGWCFSEPLWCVQCQSTSISGFSW